MSNDNPGPFPQPSGLDQPTVADVLRRANDRIRTLEARVTTLTVLLREARECIIDNDGIQHPMVTSIDKELAA